MPKIVSEQNIYWCLDDELMEAEGLPRVSFHGIEIEVSEKAAEWALAKGYISLEADDGGPEDPGIDDNDGGPEDEDVEAKEAADAAGPDDEEKVPEPTPAKRRRGRR